MKWIEEHQVALVLFAALGLKFAIYYTVKIAIKVYPTLFCCRRRFELTASGNQWAVVTGATDGIGLEFARQLAHKGYNLMLISRSEERLQQAKRQILANLSAQQPLATIEAANGPSTVEVDINCQQPSVQIRTLAVDYSNLYSHLYKKIDQFLSPAQNFIKILVNNVGMSSLIPDRFIAEEAVSHQEMINVNVVAATKMLELILPSMVQRQSGLVINVSSIAGKHLSPLMSAYAACKAYLSHLSDSLAEEHRDDGITFCTLHPFSVSTKMTHFAKVGTMTPTAEDYVCSALATIKYTDSISTTGYWSHSLLDGMFNFLTHMSSRAASGHFMKSMLEKYRKHLLETHKSNVSAENGPSDANIWSVLN